MLLVDAGNDDVVVKVDVVVETVDEVVGGKVEASNATNTLDLVMFNQGSQYVIWLV